MPPWRKKKCVWQHLVLELCNIHWVNLFSHNKYIVHYVFAISSNRWWDMFIKTIIKISTTKFPSVLCAQILKRWNFIYYISRAHFSFSFIIQRLKRVYRSTQKSIIASFIELNAYTFNQFSFFMTNILHI